MKKVYIIGCGNYMDTTYGCPGEWRCLKAAALGDGEFKEPVSVIAFVRCECPGRTLIPNIKMAMALSDIKPDEIYFSSCFITAVKCPYFTPEEMAKMIEDTFGVKVHFGTHNY